MLRRRSIPPERVRAMRSAASLRLKRASSSSMRASSSRAAHSVDLALEADVLTGGGLAVDGRLLGDDPDRAAHGVGFAGHVVAADPRLPGVGRGEGGEDLHGRRLAGAVGAEQAEDGSGRHLERDAVEGLHLVSVSLGQALDLDCIGCASHAHLLEFLLTFKYLDFQGNTMSHKTKSDLMLELGEANRENQVAVDKMDEAGGLGPRHQPHRRPLHRHRPSRRTDRRRPARRGGRADHRAH